MHRAINCNNKEQSDKRGNSSKPLPYSGARHAAGFPSIYLALLRNDTRSIYFLMKLSPTGKGTGLCLDQHTADCDLGGEGELGKMLVDFYFFLSKQLYPSMKQQPLRLTEKQGNAVCHRKKHGSKFQLFLPLPHQKTPYNGPHACEPLNHRVPQPRECKSLDELKINGNHLALLQVQPRACHSNNPFLVLSRTSGLERLASYLPSLCPIASEDHAVKNTGPSLYT